MLRCGLPWDRAWTSSSHPAGTRTRHHRVPSHLLHRPPARRARAARARPIPGAAFTAVLQLGIAGGGDWLLPPRAAGHGARAARSGPPTRAPRRGGCCTWSSAPCPIGIAGLAFRHAIEGPLRSLHGHRHGAHRGRAAHGARRPLRRRPARRSTRSPCATPCSIGLAQALALVPGSPARASRWSPAWRSGLRRDAAARFSFLLSVPAIGAAGVFELPKVLAREGHQRRRAGRAGCWPPPSPAT